MNCPKCDGLMWDNREKKRNPKAPDFKCKDENCDGVIWPPRGAKGSPSQQTKPQGRTGTGNGHSDDRSNRIERQHSQEMAIRFFTLRGHTGVSTNELRDMIDWFQRDIGKSPSKPQDNAPTPPVDDE